MATLVLTVLGDDRSGLVEALAAVVSRHDGNWDRSSMARLGTKFAGIVELTVAESRVDALIGDLGSVEADGLLDITAERVGESAGIDPPPDSAERWELQLVGHDRPGIVHEISQALARNGVSIDELHTSTSSAPMSAERLFEARAALVAVGDLDLDRLRAELESLANELMVDIDLST